MTERKYTLEEVFGYTNGESNYWKIHENENVHTRNLVTDKDDFESWEDKNYLWFSMLDRGIIFCILKDEMDLFFAHFGKTVESEQFSSRSDKTHWHIQFRNAGFVLAFPNENMEDFWEKLNDTVDVSTYEEHVTHTKNSDEVDKVFQQRNIQ